ncbi:hypothetical protein KEJ47_03845 [Candidatus Bathyarchaeota archaeon]|nr:hypothetical protein [Candidatus Bathyarchaeota archaeon]
MKKMSGLTWASVLISILMLTVPLMIVTLGNAETNKTMGKLIKRDGGFSHKLQEVPERWNDYEEVSVEVLPFDGTFENQVSPEGWYEYEEIDGSLDPDEYDQYGGGQPYSVSVGIGYVNPSGYKVTVNIKVNGVSVWSGDLSAGQRSPTITANGRTTYVRVINNNDVQIYYEGMISWYYH